jgi:hypothetical protein
VISREIFFEDGRLSHGAKSDRSPQNTLLALLAPRRLAYLKKSHAPLSPTQLCQEIVPHLPLYAR